MNRRSLNPRWLICLRNDGYSASLEPRKIYRALCVRVIDESGEDYLYPASYFAAVTLPATIERALAKAGRGAVGATPTHCYA